MVLIQHQMLLLWSIFCGKCVLLDANGKPKNWCYWFTSVHKSYLEVGSEILTTNSYAIQPYYYRRGERLIREILEEKDHRSLEGELS